MKLFEKKGRCGFMKSRYVPRVGVTFPSTTLLTMTVGKREKKKTSR
jgi:hypothetical protein